ncbi:MAG TPA: hypothetical protein VGE08_25015 [Steroidobacter sp.]|uniref:hypothetical protein n=1 Tax=Steroidobacter sp. TaxID=1978227 RepID=UPI002EDB9AF0
MQRALDHNHLVYFWLIGTSSALAAPALKAPAEAAVGEKIAIQVSGSANARDFVTIVPKGARECSYNDYGLLRGDRIVVPARLRLMAG